MNLVWDVCGSGLGDLWCALNYYTRMGERKGARQQVSCFLGADGTVDHSDRMREMLSLLRLPEAFVPQIVREPANSSSHLDAWGCLYYPTTQTWIGSDNTIAVQMDGRSSAAEKNPPESDLVLLSQWAKDRGFVLVPLGVRQTLQQCVTQLSKARAFVGVCSGMSHVAHSVRAPVHLVEYQHKVDWWHRGHSYAKHAGIGGFLRYANDWKADEPVSIR